MLMQKIPNTTYLTKKTRLNTKITKIGNEIPSITSLVTTDTFYTEVTDIENKIPDTSGFVKKTDYDAKIKEFVDKLLNHDKCITIPEFNNCSSAIFDEKLKQVHFVTRDDIAHLIKNT